MAELEMCPACAVCGGGDCERFAECGAWRAWFAERWNETRALFGAGDTSSAPARKTAAERGATIFAGKNCGGKKDGVGKYAGGNDGVGKCDRNADGCRADLFGSRADLFESRGEFALRKLGDRIFELKKRDGRSWRALAELCGVSKNTLIRYASGERVPTAEALSRIADVFGMTAGELLGEAAG